MLSQGLTILQYLVKAGAEKVIEDTRKRLHLLRMLANFDHTVADQGK